MGKLSKYEYFKLYDEKLKDEYFDDMKPLPKDSFSRGEYSRLKETFRHLNDTKSYDDR